LLFTRKLWAIFAFAVISVWVTPATRAAMDRDVSTDLGSGIVSSLKRELSKKYPVAKIDVLNNVKWTRGSAPATVQSLRILTETARGEIQFAAYGEGGASAEGWATYTAWYPARIALRRIHPGESLTMDAFITQEINIASGPAFEYRGVILPPETELQGLEARQTILEGQFLLSTAVRRVPDVRRGDVVRIQIKSGELTLSTTGVADEPGYFNNRVRVMTNKSKQVLTGELQSGRVVEVKL
jgi:flagella basal body P-ring formation protein FlgA